MTDVKASDMKLNRVRVEIPRKDRRGNALPSRFLFGQLVNEHGFLADGGQVIGLTPAMGVSHA